MIDPVPLLIILCPGSKPVIRTTVGEVSSYIFLGLKSAEETEILKKNIIKGIIPTLDVKIVTS